MTGTCAVGSSIRSIATDGSVMCQGDSNSGGTITGVTAGTGLSGGGATGSVTLSVNTSTVQARVSGTCAVGSSVRTINADGSVVCDPQNSGIATFYRAGAIRPNAANQVAHVTVNVPTSGNLLATLSFGLAVRNNSLGCNVPLKLSLTAGDLSTSPGFQQYFWPNSINTLDSGTAYGTFVSSITAAFAAPSAGSYTVYFNSGQIGAPNCSDFLWTNVTLTVVFAPGSIFTQAGAP